MSMTIEFYLAETQELVALFSTLALLQSSENGQREEDLLLDKLESYPKAEFPGRLLIPDALDSLCALFRKHRPLIPHHFEDVCIKEIWNDGLGTESLTVISDQFVHELATMSESEIEQTARGWAATFSLQEPLQQSLPYTAVVQLHNVARDAANLSKSLVFHLDGVPGFFEYLRYL